MGLSNFVTRSFHYLSGSMIMERIFKTKLKIKQSKNKGNINAQL